MGIYGMNGCGSCGSSVPHLPIMQGMQANPAGPTRFRVVKDTNQLGPQFGYKWIVEAWSSSVVSKHPDGGWWPILRVASKKDGKNFIRFAKQHGMQEALWEWSRLEADREWTKRQMRDSHLSNPATPYCNGSVTCPCVSCDYHRGGSGGRGRVVKTRAQEEAEWRAGAAGREQAYYRWLADRNRAVAAGQAPPPWSPVYYAENPGILGTIGASLVTGIGLGLGNQVAAHAYGRATGFGVQQNPEENPISRPSGSWSAVVDRDAFNAAMSVARGSYQVDLLTGGESLSGSTLKGKAKKYGDKYAASRDSLLANMSMAGIPWTEVRTNHGARILVIGENDPANLWWLDLSEGAARIGEQARKRVADLQKRRWQRRVRGASPHGIAPDVVSVPTTPEERYASLEMGSASPAEKAAWRVAREAEDYWAHAARGAALEMNPHLLVINPHGGDSVLAAIEQAEGRTLKPAERKLLKRAIREFTEFHGRPPVPEDLVQVKAPPHAGPFLVGIGEAMNVDYAVPGDFNSAREGLWTHKAGDHGRKKNTRPPYLAAIPGQKVPPVFVEPSGANMYFKPSHGVMG